MSKIFVQIASYRDPDLLTTIDGMIENAKWPENLRICIAWQHSEEDEWDESERTFFKSAEENAGGKYKKAWLEPIDIPHTESKGVCWARNQIQQRYRGQKYTLQIDSHMRFDQDWDKQLIKMVKDLQKKGHEKPLITTYASAFYPKKDPVGREMVPWKMEFDRFAPEGILHTKPHAIDEYKELDEPIPTRFYSAHFAFTVGEFCKEVPHDPLMYFHGEEPSISVRAFTWGYDLFHPHKVVIWHEYTREGKPKHWDDHESWGEVDRISFARFRGLLGVNQPREDLGEFGLGTVRSLKEYEAFSGLRYDDKTVQQHTLDYGPAPNPTIEDDDEYEASFLPFFKHFINIHINDLPEDDYQFWVIAFELADGTPLHRDDAGEDEIKRLLANPEGDFVIINRDYIGAPPEQIVVWPFSKSKEWCRRLVLDLTDF